jgi:hypothetical protein
MTPHPRIRTLLFTAILLAATAGCVPVVWLPDSSGFVYTTNTKDVFRLMHYDVSTKKLRVLVDKMPAATVCPAPGPDSKQVAVAALVSKESRTMQVILYDLTGKEVRRSPVFAWPGAKNERAGIKMTGVYWAGDRIVMHDFAEWESGNGGLGKGNSSTTGIYDLKKNTLITVEGRPAAFGGTPFLPNGKGFLISKPIPWKENTPHGVRNGLTTGLALIDWQGKVQAIDTEPIRKANLTGEQLRLLSDPWAGTSRWAGNIAEVTSGTLRLKIDMDRRSTTVVMLPDAAGKVDGADVVQRFVFPDSPVSVRVRARDNGSANQQLELLKGGKPVVLKKGGTWLLSVSPDGKWLAVREFAGDGSGPGGVIFLVNDRGEYRQFDAMPAAKD